MLMRLNKFLCVLLFCLLSVLKLLAQDPLPACPVKGKLMQSVKPMKEMKLLYDTIQVRVDLPAAFKEVGYNEIIDSLGILSPVLEHLRLVKGGILEDTVRILHIGDSHIRGAYLSSDYRTKIGRNIRRGILYRYGSQWSDLSYFYSS